MVHIELSDDTFQKEVLDSKDLVLVDFWAPWCMPCQMLGRIIEEISNEVGEKVKIGKMNVDENRKFPEKYNVMSIPNVILFKNGEIVEQFVGVRSKEDYLGAINNNLEK